MNIEIAVQDKMTVTGSSLIRSIQNNSMPVLDLFVRESLQNSLDAKKTREPFVQADFQTGEFDAEKFCSVFEGIERPLRKRFSKDQYSYIAVRDSHTEGLTGNLDFSKVENNDYGNLNKLVYSIGKAQQQEGAGGSWGLGKTVYYRVGIGLVLFYSRIEKRPGYYESRMAATLVEDERKHSKALIPPYGKKSPSGIAWWGKSVYGEQNKTCPTTNEREIKNILDIMSIEPYKGKETGTMIIIPFIDEEELLSHNQVHNNGIWRHRIEDYLKLSIQKWYAPRLNNASYPFGPALRASVNGQGLAPDDMLPFFKLIRRMYQCGTTRSSTVKQMEKEFKIKREDIKINGVLNTQIAGWVIHVNADRKLLKMTSPDHYPSPYELCNCYGDDEELNKPIVLYTRGPGMVVSYETESAWTSGIEKTDSDHFIIALFILNSNNMLKEKFKSSFNGSQKRVLSLEEYVRASEMADHNSWNDMPIQNENPIIVSKIRRNVSKKIAEAYKSNDKDHEKRKEGGLGNRLGQLLLPPEGFGKKASSGGKKLPNEKKNPSKSKKHYFNVLSNNITYMTDGMEVDMEACIDSSDGGMNAELGINSESSYITLKNWVEEYHLDCPFEVEDIKVRELDKKGKVLDEECLNSAFSGCSMHGTELELVKNKNGNIYGIKILNKDRGRHFWHLKTKVHLYNRDVNIQFKESWIK